MILAAGSLAWPVASSTADGRLRWSAPAESTAKMRIFAADGRGWQGEIGAGSALLEPELAGDLVVGRVKTPAGEPIAGALVWPAHDPGRFVLSAADGTFRLMTPASGELMVHAEAPGLVPKTMSWPGTQRGVLELKLVPASELLGSILATTGEPIPRARIELRDQDRRVIRLGSAADGSFRIDGLEPGAEVQLRVLSRGFAATSQSLIPPSALPVRVQMQPLPTAFGRVLDLDELPVANAQVKITPGHRKRPIEGAKSTAAQPGLRSRTDTEGRFAVYQPLPWRSVDLTARASGHAPMRVPGIRIDSNAGSVDLGVLLLDSEARIEGRVLDTEGRPIADVGLWIEPTTKQAAASAFAALRQAQRTSEPESISDQHGRFTISQLAPGSSIDVLFSAPGYATHAQFNLAAPSRDDQVTSEAFLEAVLQPAVSVYGRIETPAGEGLGGAQISLQTLAPDSLHRAQSSYAGTSDEHGHFEIADVPAGRFSLAATVPGWRPAAERILTVEVAHPPGDLLVVLEPGTWITGMLSAEDGQPIAEARVSFEGLEVRSGDDGSYLLAGLEPEKRGLLQVEHEAFQIAQRPVRPSWEGAIEDFELRSGTQLTGTVIDSDRMPVAGVSLRMAPTDPRQRRGYRSSSDRDGVFDWPSVADGSYLLVAEKEGFSVARRKVELVPQDGHDELEIMLLRGASLVGRLSGLPYEELTATTVILRDEDHFERELTVDYEGRFEARDLRPGGWRLVATTADGRRQAAASVVIRAEDDQLTRNLEFRGLSVDGLVLIEGQSLAGAEIVLDGVDVPGRRSLRTDVDGGFRLEDLTPGRYRLGVLHERPRILHHRVVDLFDDRRQLVIELETAEVAGQVVDQQSGEPVSGALIALRELLGTSTDGGLRTTGTDETGRFQFPRVGHGHYELEVRARGFMHSRQSLELSAGSSSEDLRIAIEPTAGLNLRVALASGKAPPMVHVRSLDAAGRLALAESQVAAADGRVRLPSLAPGRHQLWIGAPEAASRRFEIEVPGDPVDGDPVDVILQPAGRLRIRILDLQDSARLGSLELLVGDGRPWTHLGIGGEARSSFPIAGGVAILDDVPAGSWTLAIHDGEGRRWQHAITTSGSPEIEVLLE